MGVAERGRLLGPAALVVVGALILLVVLGPGGGYELKAQFHSAGQLVEGGEVRVGGRVVGSIEEIELNDSDLAEVTLEIDDDDLTPLNSGTRAQIRSIGPATLANRYVNLLPGSREEPELESGTALGPEQTDGIIELDALLDTFDDDTRADLERLITAGADVFAGSGDRRWNSMLAKLDPALAGIQGVFGEAASDQARIDRLIEKGGSAAEAIASRRPDLVEAVASSAEWMNAIAAERERLGGAIAGAAPALEAATGTLAKADEAVTELRPALPDLTRSAGPLADVLERTRTTLPKAAAPVAELRAQLPDLRAALRRFDSLEKPLTKAFGETGPGFNALTPILEGTRIYSLDVVLGAVNGLAGLVAGNFNAQGHYLHANFSQSPQTLLTSPLSDLFTSGDLVPGALGLRPARTATCPGGLMAPAPDGSSPNHDRPDLCDPAHSMPASVNSPPGAGR